ncbi:hypothetical protein TNCV_4546201 [Trichonephila clavipes]|nr:hypothetical protein TNCV_4546201 [Trichonephila clavipes]
MEGFANTDPAGSRLLRSVSRDIRMKSYSNEELVYMLIVNKDVDFNGHTARWLYQELKTSSLEYLQWLGGFVTCLESSRT